MNILFSCDEYPPAKTGGIGSATKIVCEALAARGHNVYVICGSLPIQKLPKENTINGVTVYSIPFFDKIDFLWNSFIRINLFHNILLNSGILAKYAMHEQTRRFSFIRKIIKEKDIDIVELPDYSVLDKYYMKHYIYKYPKLNVPTIGRLHGSRSFLSYFKFGFINPKEQANNTEFLKICDSVCSVSLFSLEFAKKKLGLNKDSIVIYNPLDTNFINNVKNSNTPRQNNIVFLGKIIETKGAFNLLKAFNIFSKEFTDYKLILIGGGFIDRAKKLLSKEASEKVVFTGYIDRDKIAYYLKSAAFCVVPTFFENFSVAALEIMGCSNILVYTSEASGPETIDDGVDGFLVNPHDIKDIYNKMCFIANNLKSLLYMREAARNKVINNFSENIIINQLESYYSSILHKN